MRPIIPLALVGIALMSSALAAEAGDPKPSPAAPTGAAAAPASDKKIVFGVITPSADKKSLTIEVKGVATTLKITPDTEVTIDLKKAALEAVTTVDPVRVMYSGDIALSIDQTKAEKKKKKKKM
ncbi:MAG: hypothetical protein H0W83_00870 [Planctomycetes bacterium]|nr:hypothetical protein [Planctomycetota bacterium]